MLKKWLCVAVILSALLTLPACGRKPVPSAGDSQTQATATIQSIAPTDGTEGTVPQQQTVATLPVENTETQPTVPPATRPSVKPETETLPPETQPPQEAQIPQETQPTPTIPPQVETPVPTYGHTPLAKTEYYQYTAMTATEKQLYNKLIVGIENLQNEIPISGISIGTDEGMALFYRVIADNPQLFWVSRKVSVSYDPRTMTVQSFVVLYTDGEKADTVNGNQPVAVADRTKIAAKRTALNEKIGQIMGVIPANYPEIDREKLIHDYIVTHLQYDTVAAGSTIPVDSILPHAYDIYGAAVEGKAVCEGYAKLFQYLCYQTGINATQISGKANGGGHMWNAVKLDGDWYEIDVTWDDSGDALLYYRYFNLTHSQMAQNHTADLSENPFPQCNGTKYRYADYYALKVLNTTEVSDNYKAVVDRLITAGSDYLIVYKNGVQMNPEIYNTLVYNDTALINQYARQRGYRLKLARSYTIYEDFIYIACTAEKL